MLPLDLLILVPSRPGRWVDVDLPEGTLSSKRRPIMIIRATHR